MAGIGFHHHGSLPLCYLGFLHHAQTTHGVNAGLPAPPKEAPLAQQCNPLLHNSHWRPTTQLPEDIVQMPKGDQFSYMGDVATRECLTRLKALLKQAGSL